MSTKVWIDNYLETKRLAWSTTTLRSEKYRLYAISEQLTGDATQLWTHISATLKPYTRVTVWTRVVEFWQYLLDEGLINGKNEYKIFREKNARLFKNTYQKRTPDISFEEAKRRIDTITKDGVREKALQLLKTGMRFNESNSFENGTVIGKGGKHRTIFISSGPIRIGYQEFYRELKKVGLKPHVLRKIFGSRLVENGANEFELCELMGWSNLNTASSYIKTNKNRLKDLVNKVNL